MMGLREDGESELADIRPSPEIRALLEFDLSPSGGEVNQFSGRPSPNLSHSNDLTPMIHPTRDEIVTFPHDQRRAESRRSFQPCGRDR